MKEILGSREDQPCAGAAPRFLPAADGALVVELGAEIDAAVNAQIIALATAVERAAVPGITEIVPTYRSLLLRYEPRLIRGVALETLLRGMLDDLPEGEGVGRRWSIPVVYGGAVGQDLDEMARMKQMTVQQVIQLHAAADYRVFMVGFAPGFAYLGGLDKALHTPRLAKPRQYVPAGGIGIGGQQASVNSVAGPSGWRFIGWTPVRVFDPTRAEPFLLRAGDRLRFAPIDAATGESLAARDRAGEQIIRPEVQP
ncbi:5-oxoprolinase subunit PxpB [Paracoccus aminophilus]|uniref:Allophanate hydrolase subunit 1 n=1 Tax=Paracoccus aminophilus JCM 7686 TaxID=1367847 RepID=S5XMN8_PARAH|nr:5-oxoprolinase subunit PxpB [Paracoccus aminophilus]AGT08539.1 allophanate hydrolase subunit 1 [Paracoccus aminophilus JCM 7686]